MRYITLPEPVELPIPADKSGTPLQYTLERFLVENCWSHPIWHETATHQEAFFRIYDKFAEAFKSEGKIKVVALEDADYEVFLPIATQRGVKLREDLVYPLQMLMRCFFTAASKAQDQPS